MKQKLLYGLAAAILIAGGAYFLLNSGNKAEAPVSGTSNNSSDVPPITEVVTDEGFIPTDTNYKTAPPTKNTLVFSTQTAGSQVIVDNVYLEKPGFIVIHEVKNDNPGTIVGSSGWLPSGPGQDISFKSTLKSGVTYFGLLYEDNGDKKFNSATDKKLPLFSLQSDTYNEKGVVQFEVAK